MSTIPLGGGVGALRAVRPRTLVSNNKYYSKYDKIYRPIPKLKFWLSACVVCKSLRQRTTCSPSLYLLWTECHSDVRVTQSLVYIKFNSSFQSSLMYNADRGGYKAESLLGHITKKATSSLPSHPVPFPSPSLELGRSNPARGSGGALRSGSAWGGATAKIEFGAFFYF